jgi:hypothetical protein
VTIRRYSELIKLPTFEERFRYLKLNGVVAHSTFGGNRYLNQEFYKSANWLEVRDYVIVRDNGFDLGVEFDDYRIPGTIIVHHMNPITIDDIINQTEFLLNPDYLISVSLRTHNGIHYGDEGILKPAFVERKPWDTCPWKQQGGM